MSQQIRGAVIGYGGAFNMGKGHLNWMKDAGMVPTAACDLDAKRMEAAAADFPGIRTYTTVEALLADKDVDLVTIITPHNTHSALAVQVASAGKHVVVEKPMAISVEQCTAMIDAAKKAGTTLSVFHNRRYDGDYLALKEAIEKGLIGEVYEIHACSGGYHKPGTWWRSYKAVSGGLMYDWGAHFIDWILNLQSGRKITQVTGFLHKRVWHEVTNEDHGQIIIRFDNGSTAQLTQSTIDSAPGPRWRILGTTGALIADPSVKDGFKLIRQIDGLALSGEIHNKPTEWNTYYKDLNAHLIGEAPLAVTPESARRVISVIEAAEKSSKAGKSVEAAFE
ncbi:MAG: Gfo/Idh/MocA family oxidoreductase [Capsulimonadaceae bacterium]|nr:Gfo/Idh/MocA family oxidoreductase [Capsulimonadaceae bacterium]